MSTLSTRASKLRTTSIASSKTRAPRRSTRPTWKSYSMKSLNVISSSSNIKISLRRSIKLLKMTPNSIGSRGISTSSSSSNNDWNRRRRSLSTCKLRPVLLRTTTPRRQSLRPNTCMKFRRNKRSLLDKFRHSRNTTKSNWRPRPCTRIQPAILSTISTLRALNRSKLGLITGSRRGRLISQRRKLWDRPPSTIMSTSQSTPTRQSNSS